MKRWICKLVLFLLLGVVVNVAVAWGCAYWMDRELNSIVTNKVQQFKWEIEDFLYLAEVYARRGSTLVAFWHKEGRWSMSRYLYSEWALPTEETNLPTWSMAAVAYRNSQTFSDDPDEERLAFLEVAYGWPALATFYRSEVKQSLTITELRYGLDISPAGSSFPKNIALPRVLPLRPIWPGFAINTIFYAALLWLLTLGPFTARRMLRRKRGHCIQCGYDLRGMNHDKCPECGQ